MLSGLASKLACSGRGQGAHRGAALSGSSSQTQGPWQSLPDGVSMPRCPGLALLTQTRLNCRTSAFKMSLRSLPVTRRRELLLCVQERKQRPREERVLAHGCTAQLPLESFPYVLSAFSSLLEATASSNFLQFNTTNKNKATSTEGLVYTRHNIRHSLIQFSQQPASFCYNTLTVTEKEAEVGREAKAGQ